MVNCNSMSGAWSYDESYPLNSAACGFAARYGSEEGRAKALRGNDASVASYLRTRSAQYNREQSEHVNVTDFEEYFLCDKDDIERDITGGDGTLPAPTASCTLPRPRSKRGGQPAWER